ncbi:MAG: hypothetical protein ACYS5V_09745 [Planctomycetota bacterium]|jgi:hypothetical protein
MADSAERSTFPTLPAPPRAPARAPAHIRVTCRRVAHVASAWAVGTYLRARACDPSTVPSILINVVA